MDLSGLSRRVVVPTRTDRTGRRGPTPELVRGGRWRRTSRGYYVPADVVPTDLNQQIVEAAVILPAGPCGVTGWAGLAWDGGRWFDGTPWGGGASRPVTLAIGGLRTIRPQPGIRTSEERLDPQELVSVDGLSLTAHPRSVCFEMRYAPTDRLAVVSLDMAAFNDLVSIEEVNAYASGLNGWTGIPRCRWALLHADENAWSPQEVLMRLVWTLDARLPRPLTNRPVFDVSGTHLGTPDLIDPLHGVVGEYDGALHLAGSQRLTDVDREDVFRSNGLEYVTMLAGDRLNPSGFLGRLASAYHRAAEIPTSRKRWTIEVPSWWTDTTTVAARRALTESERERLLRNRAA